MIYNYIGHFRGCIFCFCTLYQLNIDESLILLLKLKKFDIILMRRCNFVLFHHVLSKFSLRISLSSPLCGYLNFAIRFARSKSAAHWDRYFQNVFSTISKYGHRIKFGLYLRSYEIKSRSFTGVFLLVNRKSSD